jgi:hypothetical protein
MGAASSAESSEIANTPACGDRIGPIVAGCGFRNSSGSFSDVCRDPLRRI